ncbi:hypothetical protein G8764_06310 [Pseudomaricurvus alcaniphilus]|uniref:hypothetical protein n=1 Tax=Pseudomaricurvus alcaniphilus TaxID=1166482 RepID=UPI00140B3AB8|nr:hypothetical protein [Pseudomaricurvus alcaniphilus]NHN36899.1 hypothetical protein [Pseudomaricurvus alcaniphilus]
MNSYQVEVRQEIITPPLIEAKGPQEASEAARVNQGVAGNSYPGGVEIISEKLLRG